MGGGTASYCIAAKHRPFIIEGERGDGGTKSYSFPFFNLPASFLISFSRAIFTMPLASPNRLSCNKIASRSLSVARWITPCETRSTCGCEHVTALRLNATDGFGRGVPDKDSNVYAPARAEARETNIAMSAFATSSPPLRFRSPGSEFSSVHSQRTKR
jgi:hypothetical protein